MLGISSMREGEGVGQERSGNLRGIEDLVHSHPPQRGRKLTHTHTQAHGEIYIHIYTQMYPRGSRASPRGIQS